MVANYSEDSIKTLDWKEHIRRRPGMYIGKLGDGSAHDDGIYVMLKEVLDNSVDEYAMGNGKNIDISINGQYVEVRDYGRGIPLGKLIDVASKMNTGAKYDDAVFKKSVGLNGVGIKAVNALSSNFTIQTFREGKANIASFKEGVLVSNKEEATKERNGVLVKFEPDRLMFGNYHFVSEYIESMLRNYSYLNSGLSLNYNGATFFSQRGLYDLLQEKMSGEGLYPVIHLKGEDIEIALTHGIQYGEEYYSFVNGQNTSQGGSHLVAYKEALVKTIRDFYKRNLEPADIRASIISAVSIKVSEPMFESQTKTKLGSKTMMPNGGITISKFIGDFVGTQLDNFLHKNPITADILLKKILDNEKERKAISGIQKIARDRAKKANLHNRKLRDCRLHYNSNDERRQQTTIFITEGDSASGSITKSRDVNVQAVFSLKGKPLNSYGETKKVVYENEEFNLLQAALNIEEGIESLRYNNVVIATDADVDGMHIRLLLITFFLQFFPDLVKHGHLYILQTPLFRARNKKDTKYCYSEEEKQAAVKKLGANCEITRFKGLGEISPDEFKHFIGRDIRLEPVILSKLDSIAQMLEFYMGKNTPDRQNFIIDNLRFEVDTEEVLLGK